MKTPTLLVGCLVLAAGRVFATTELQSGEFTVVKNQVKHTVGTSTTAAQPKEKVQEKSMVNTGAASLTELDFADASVLRLGANTRFSFQSKERIIKLEEGTLLMNVPPGNGGITVDGGGVTGAVSGTTIMVSRDAQGNFGFLILEGAGGGTVIGKDGVPVSIVAGQMAIATSDGKPTTVVEVHVDAVRDISPLFEEFPTKLNGAEKVLVTTEFQSDEIQNNLKLLSSLKDFDLTQSDPEGVALAMICGVGQEEMGAARNILLRPLDTAAGNEAGAEQGGLVAVGGSGFPVDARQEEAEPLLATTTIVSSGGLVDESTAAGGGGDSVDTDTAAGGEGGADTQAPLPPVLSPASAPPTTPN